MITTATSVFDYGCGRGGDISRLVGAGITARGFDPSFRPDAALERSDIVNLGYVVNVIEDADERAEALRAAWSLTDQVLIVSARLQGEERRIGAAEAHADGFLTGLGTFQKFFTQSELREWIDNTLGGPSVAAEPGVFYVFREPARAEAYLLARVRRGRPRARRSDVVFDEHQELLEEFMDFLEDAGRVPRAGEFVREAELRDKVGTPRQAFQVIKTVTDEERWDRARVRRYEDLLVYLALSRFRRRPKFSHLPGELQHDIKDFFGSYKAGCEAADRALFAIAEQSRVREAIYAAKVGKRMPSALYVHASAISRLPTTLRVLEGCARELLGSVPDATIIKIDVERARVAYLQYPAFDEDPHPVLRGAYVAVLDSLRTDFVDFDDRANPPILHRKERFVAPDYPGREKFQRLTRQEERYGLFKNPGAIGTAKGWSAVLERAGVRFLGHRLVRDVGATSR